MNTLFVIDIDNTVADATRRIAVAGTEPDRIADELEYDRWLLRVQDHHSLSQDPVVAGMRELVQALDYAHSRIVYLTAREYVFASVTEEWLSQNGFPVAEILMRPEGNTDNSAVFKEKMITLSKGLHRAEHVLVMDDDARDELRGVCQRNGWTFLKCHPGVVNE